MVSMSIDFVLQGADRMDKTYYFHVTRMDTYGQEVMITQRKMNINKVFSKVPKIAFFSAQNILDPVLSLYMYFFIPKVLLKDQKILNLRRIKMIKECLRTFVLVLSNYAKRHNRRAIISYEFSNQRISRFKI